MNRVVRLGMVLALTVFVVACSAQVPPATTVSRKPAEPQAPYLGLAAVTPRQLPSTAAYLGRRPDMVEVYRTFGEPFAAVHAPEIVEYGAMPFVQLNPYGISLASITAGHYDSYLRHYAAAIAHLGHRVAVSFAAEANGSWWRWGCHNVTAGGYVAAWRHIHDIMTPASGNRIIWVWDVNKELRGDCPLVARWPGSHYVTWVGLDAYWRSPGDTFASAVEPTINKIRHFTSKSILIAETGVPRVTSAPKFIRSLFVGARDTTGVIGIVWFDYHSYRGDYQLQDDPPALAEFRREAVDYH